MFPALVVLIVNTQRSIIDTIQLTVSVGGTGTARQPGYRPATIGHLSFAAPPTVISPIESLNHSDSLKGPDRSGSFSDEEALSRR